MAAGPATKSSWIRQWSVTGQKAYALAILLTLALGALRLSLEPWIGMSVPYAVFVPAMVVVPFFAGFRPAIVSVMLMIAFASLVLMHGAPPIEKAGVALVGMVTVPLVSFTVYALRSLLLEVADARAETEKQRHAAEVERQSAESERDRAALLSRELNHRVKNLFAVVNSIISLSARSDPAAKDTVNKIRGRVTALSAAHTLEFADGAERSVPLRHIVATTLKPYGDGGFVVAMDGPDVMLPYEAVTPTGLILHELATNAVKYGALSASEGQVSAVWTVDADGWVEFCWTETGGPKVAGLPGKTGFGSIMLQQAEAQLGATVNREWLESGLRVTLRFPLEKSR